MLLPEMNLCPCEILNEGCLFQKKNRDAIFDEHVAAMTSCNNKLVAELFAELFAEPKTVTFTSPSKSKPMPRKNRDCKSHLVILLSGPQFIVLK
jgi:hypothetical protein